MRWRRAIVAVVVGLLVMQATSFFIVPIVGVVQQLLELIQFTSDPVYAYVTAFFVTSLITLPSLIAAVLVYGLGKPPGDGHTHCGNCSYILKGLTVPRCPECGEGI